jgi:hypothetical protein
VEHSDSGVASLLRVDFAMNLTASEESLPSRRLREVLNSARGRRYAGKKLLAMDFTKAYICEAEL